MIYNLRTVPFERHSAVESLTNHNSELDVLSEDLTLDELKEALKDVGNNWERVPLKHSDGRVGWQDALIGCLKDVRQLLVLLSQSMSDLYHAARNNRNSSSPSQHLLLSSIH